MKPIHEEDIRNEAVLEVARKMMIAARTAPKGRGVDNLVIALLGPADIKKISDHIKEMAEGETLPKFFLRDADNILAASAMLLLGTKIKPLELKPCGMCGFADCREKDRHPDHPCVFNSGDLGIAIGSAVSVAMEHRVDNRIMYTVGQAAIRMGILGDDVKIVYGIPLSVGAKNPFFDRKD